MVQATQNERPRTARSAQLRPENLAAIFQEGLTVVVRLRSGRLQVAEATEFRRQFQELLRASEVKSRERGYSAPAINLAILAVVAFLDESVLLQEQRGLTQWRGNPLSLALYGDNRAGEKFFENLRKLLVQPDNDELADVLEVFYLCLLLGYKGMYGVTPGGELNSLCGQLANRIVQIRQSTLQLSPASVLPRESIQHSKDSGTRRLVSAIVILLVVTILLFAGFKLSLQSSLTDLEPAKTETAK